MQIERLGFQIRNRRGAAAVLLLVMTVALLGILAVVIDTTRIFALKSELQTAVDAAAHAGAIELALGTGDPSRDTAISYALRNFAEGSGVVVQPQDVVFGVWDDVNWTFSPLPSAAGADAINVVATRQVDNYLAWILGITQSTVLARATGWAAAPIGETSCVKPWALPEELIDLDNNGTVDPAEVQTAIGQRFTLKSATGGNADTLTSSGLPSFFYPVVLPPFWDASTGQYIDISGSTGAANYRNNIGTCFPQLVGVGDSLKTEPGNMPGPTVQGAQNFCTTIVNNYCYDANGQHPKLIAAFWDSDVNPIGRASVEIATLAAFRLEQVYPQGQHGVIVGIFEEMVTSGGVGPGATTAITPKLVR